MSGTVPNPAMLAQIIKQRQAATLEPSEKAKIVRPGLVEAEVHVIHDGVLKTKHLMTGMTVRPYLHGEPRGGERIVKSVTRIEDGAMWHVEFESAHVAQDYKAAYRWYCEAMDGAVVSRKVKKPAFVKYEES